MPVFGRHGIATADPTGHSPKYPNIGPNRCYESYAFGGRFPLVEENGMSTVSAFEFQRRYCRFQHVAQREPAETTLHGCREFVLLSAEQFDWLRASAQRSHRADAAADALIDDVERAEMHVVNRPFDDLLK